MGLGQNLLDTPTLRSGAYVSPNVTAHAPTGIAAIDRTMLVQAIGDTPRGGWLALPNNGDTPYVIDQTLVINKAMRMSGGGVHALFGSQSISFETINVPLTAPFLSGTVISQVTAGTDVIQLPVAGMPVHLEGFGIIFDSAIRWTNTGHAINATPPAYGSGYDNGLTSAKWDHISVYGHDGNHYAFYFINPIYNTFIHLRSWGGGTLYAENNSSGNGQQGNYGNLLVDHIIGQVIQAGSAHGIRLVQTAGFFNLVQFNRPQITVESETAAIPATTAPTSSQQIFYADPTVSWLSLIAPDFETGVNSPVTLPTTPAYEGGITVDPAGNVPNNTWGRPNGLSGARIDYRYQRWLDANGPANWIWSELVDDVSGTYQYGYQFDGKRIWHLPRLQIDVPGGFAAVAGAGAGTTPPAPVVTGCNDSRGTVTFGTGTTPTAGAQVTATFQTVYNNAPTVVITPANAATVALGLYVTDVTSSGFTVSAENAPAASQANTVYSFTFMVIG